MPRPLYGRKPVPITGPKSDNMHPDDAMNSLMDGLAGPPPTPVKAPPKKGPSKKPGMTPPKPAKGPTGVIPMLMIALSAEKKGKGRK